MPNPTQTDAVSRAGSAAEPIDLGGALRAAFQLNTRLLLNCLEGVSDEDAQRRLSNETNNIGFIACHLVDGRHYVAKLVGRAQPNPLQELLAQAHGIDDVADLPPLAAVRDYWTAVSRTVEERVGQLQRADLAAPSPERFPIEDATFRGAINFLLHHEAFHIGQIALLRKYLGYPAMAYQ